MRILFNDGQEIVQDDFNQIAQASETELYDRIAFQLGLKQENFCFDDSFLVEYLSSTSVTVRAGVGFQTDNTQTSPEPKKRLLALASQATKTLAAPDGANPRIDIVSIKATRVVTATENRNFKDVTEVLSVQSMDVKSDWELDCVVTTGTPSGSPAIPSTPAGYIKIAELAIAAGTGLPSTGGITDKRSVFLQGSSRSSYATKTANYTLTPMDEMILGDATSGNLTFALPPASSCPGKIVRIKKIDSSANTLTIDPYLSELIDGESTQVIENQYTCLTLLSINSGWSIIS